MTRLFDLLDYQLKNTPIEASFNGRNKDGNWESYSTQKLKDTAEDWFCMINYLKPKKQ